MPIIAFILSSLSIFFIFRLILFFIYFDRIHSVENAYLTFLIGIRMDLIILSYLSVVPTLLLLVFPKVVLKFFKYIFAVIFASVFTFFVFMEIATIPFVKQFDLRPDQVFYEYLKYPKEIFAMVSKTHSLELVLSAIIACLTFILFYKFQMSIIKKNMGMKWWKRIVLCPILLALLFIGARSSFKHRPANISTAYFSNNHLLNEITLNSSYTFLYSIYRLKHEKNPSSLYGVMESSEILRRVKNHSKIDKNLFIKKYTKQIPTLHYQKTNIVKKRPMNVVIFIQESMGAEHVGVLGGLPLTPNFDSLSKEGLLFTKMYSTGTRTIRGLEALTTGFFPTTGRSIVKLGGAKKNFFTAGHLFKKHGYITEFIYGGEAHFDEMKSFFLGNGFSEVHDGPTFENIKFNGSWGASDEDLAHEAHKKFVSHGDKPFFAIMLSTSNHSPYDYPEGRIKLYDKKKASQFNAMKYADFAIGEFFRLAKTASYYKNTIFVVIADHSTRVFGDSLVPIHKFNIPALILAKGVVAPGIYSKVASQVDILPTILHWVGINTKHPMLGYNLMTLPKEVVGHAFMQYGNHYALMEDNIVTIFRPHLDGKQFIYSKNKLLPYKDNKDNEEQIKDSLAHVLLPWFLYKNKQYTLPELINVNL